MVKGNVRDVYHWPPGALMQFANGNFSAIGLVVWNYDRKIAVLWPEHCWDRFCVYSVDSLNPATICRVE